MSAQWRWSVIGFWIVLSCIVFLAVGSTSQRSWLLLMVAAAIPPAMLLWFSSEDQSMVAAPLRLRHRR
jgi:hypothetical protein